MAVEIHGLSISYHNFFKKSGAVLNNIELNISAGQIYGILGPSGCGKTTLLRCIVGRLKAEKGTVTVFGNPPGTPGLGVPGPAIGYMPQDLALVMELTISETLWYFSLLVGMDAVKATERTRQLSEMLKLPKDTSQIRDLSGGQKRRVSLAATLIHEPNLLILDEPTVGVDPQLRFSIWEHLTALARDTGATIIITTHYTEEARKANTVGLMRSGRFLVQSCPNELMERSSMTTLEAVFLHLCRKDEPPIQNSSCCKTVETIELTTEYYKPKLNDNNGCNRERRHDVKYYPSNRLKRLLALIIRNAITMWRNKIMMIFQLLMPLVHVLLFYTQMGSGEYKFDVGVVNNDQSFLGGVFLNGIDTKVIAKIMLPSEESLLERAIKGDFYGTILIRPNFTEATMSRYAKGINTSYDKVEESRIRVRLDTSYYHAAQLIKQELWLSYKTFIEESLQDFKIDPNVAALPLDFTTPIYGDDNPKPIAYILPALFTHIPFFLSAILTALVFVGERNDGLLDRSWVSGVTAAEVLASHLIIQGIFMICEMSIPIIWFFCFSNLQCYGPSQLFVLVILLQGVCGLTFGFFLSAVLPDESTVIQACVGTLMICLNLCGFVWPVEAMPTWLAKLSYIMPQTIGSRGLRSIMSRGWTMKNFQVWMTVLYSILWSAFGLGLSALFMSFRRSTN